MQMSWLRHWKEGNEMKRYRWKNYNAEIVKDADPQNPREERDNLGTMVFLHKRYQLGDKHDLSSDEVVAMTKRDDIIWLPVYMFDHSGLTLRTDPSEFQACDPHGWDWGQLGIIYVTHADVLREWEVKEVTPELRERVERVLRIEVETYSQYLQGDVWGYSVTDSDGTVLDSCYGFYGNFADMLLVEACAAIAFEADVHPFRVQLELEEVGSNG
jgi:hypothetical protein